MELQVIQNKIHEIRGRRVMLDFDLAALYEVETKRLKEAVRRNIERFEGEDFMFELSDNEIEILSRTQFATLNKGRGSNIKYSPFAFTELGVAMREYLLTRSAQSAELNDLIHRVQALEKGSDETLEAVNDLGEDIQKDIDNIYVAIGELSIKLPKLNDKSRRPMGYRFDINDQ